MKMKVIDLLNAKHENKLKEGFKFVLRDKVYQARLNAKKDLILAIPGMSTELRDNHYIENILDEEIDVLTPELISLFIPYSERNYTQEDLYNLLDYIKQQGTLKNQ